MDHVPAGSLIQAFLSLLLFSYLLGMLAAWVWALRRVFSRRSLLDPAGKCTTTSAPWGFLTVLAVVMLYLLVNVGVARVYAAATGRQFARGVQGPEKPAVEPPVGKADIPKNAVKPQPPQPEPGHDPERSQTQTEVLIQLAIINGVLVLLIPFLVHMTSGANLADLGIQPADWTRQVLIGVVAALLMTPAVLAIQSLAVQLWSSRKHPVEEMMLGEFSGGAAILAVLSTMVLAPMIEELLFRGIIQRWLSLLLGDRSNIDDQNSSPSPEFDEPDLAALWPVSQTPDPLSATAPEPWLAPAGRSDAKQASRAPSPLSTLAIVLTSITFAALHMPQWPAPIGIFVLSLALGAVYQSTGSLITVMAMHGTFNGFSTVAILLQALGRQLLPGNGAPATLVAALVSIADLFNK